MATQALLGALFPAAIGVRVLAGHRRSGHERGPTGRPAELLATAWKGREGRSWPFI